MNILRTRYRELETVVASLISLNHDDANLASKVLSLKISAQEAFHFKEAARNSTISDKRKFNSDSAPEAVKR